MKFSKACAAKLGELRDRGYGVISADVRFVVAWKGKEDDDETAVLLADLHLFRHDPGKPLRTILH